jgi:hypothetical protein
MNTRIDNDEFKKNLGALIDFLKENYDLNCVILFGSRARGDFQPHSDVDLIIVGDFDQKFFDRGDPVRENYVDKEALDIFCYTPEEYREMFFKGVVSILDSIDEGIPLFGKDYFEDYGMKLKKLKRRGLKKDAPVWILPKSMTIE